MLKRYKGETSGKLLPELPDAEVRTGPVPEQVGDDEQLLAAGAQPVELEVSVDETETATGLEISRCVVHPL